MTKVYVNKNWTKREYEITNVVMQVTDEAPRNFNGSPDDAGNWVEVDAQEVSDWEELTLRPYPVAKGFEPLGGFGGHRFYGYL